MLLNYISIAVCWKVLIVHNLKKQLSDWDVKLTLSLRSKKAEILGENSEHCCISSISTGFQWTCSEVKMFPLFTFDWLLMEYCYTARCIGPSVVQEPIKSLEGVSTWWSWQFNKRRNTDMKCSFRHFASFLKGLQVTKDSCGLADGCVGKKTQHIW